ncbi:Cu-binding protein [Apophysomyces sp. BC1034]|nr:Cu-binding protein [Apophysomyces sp. BC1015]KAG0176495.1 Cu-binding protein [Apophysomyces sp. BC1021]KAG0186620.1 Cu-binding protein [Apophysomyces sp. BC1034]
MATLQILAPRHPAVAYRKPWVRLFTTSSEEPARKRVSGSPFTWKSAVVLVATGIGLVAYFKNEKERLRQLRLEKDRETSRSFGRPKIGGPFTLTEASTGQPMSSNEFLGQYYMLYFGFTHCPDICPEELDKMAEVVDTIKADKELGEGVIVPVFITCDPRRDTPDTVKEYVKDFHPDLVGFTGPFDEVRNVARSFRVYMSVPPNVTEGDDYLVDHSIFFYLMDPEGKFVDCYGRDTTPEEITTSFKKYVREYLAQGGKLPKKVATA